MGKPNLFNYATSELSQDAFICWLLSWADPKHKENDEQLHKIATALLNKFFEVQQKTPPAVYRSIDIHQQYKKIDVYALINKEFAIIIEDKVNTDMHSDQLIRYVNKIKEDKIEPENIIKIYFKTGDQSNYRDIQDKGYSPFSRHDVLGILATGINHGISNQIFVDYYEYLKGVESKINLFNTLPVQEWGPKSWEWVGFFKNIQKQLNDGDWEFVNNTSGGFYGFWWHWKNDNECKQYLQLEETKLCFKIEVKDKAKQAGLKYKWSDLILKAAENTKIRVIKPVLRNGLTMTVAVADSDYRQADNEGKIDLDKTVSVLQEAQKILDKAVNA
jgi:hypothetical protein